jgi:hypothetical protein
MKKRAAKKTVARPAAKKKTGGSKVKKAAPKAAAPSPKPTPYTPAAIKSDGWPPFRYPLG